MGQKLLSTLYQLSGIVVPFTNDEIDQFWPESEPWLELVVIFWERLITVSKTRELAGFFLVLY